MFPLSVVDGERINTCLDGGASKGISPNFRDNAEIEISHFL
jgi:hypothetical protein